MSRSFDPRRMWSTIIHLLRTGLTPEKLALTVVLGFVLGVFPVVGSTTILCGAAALALGLNLPLIQAVNYLVYPLQIIMIIPFMRAGGWIFGSPRLAMSAGELRTFVTTDPVGAISALGVVTGQAVVAWIAFAIVSSLLVYLILVPLLRRFVPSEQAT